MKKLLVIVAILAAAAACGGATSTGGTSNLSSSTGQRYTQSQPGALGGQPAKTSTGGGTTSNPPATDVVPPVQGPRVIRQAELALTVDSGQFDSKLSAVRMIVESQQGFIAGTDAQVAPYKPNDQIRSGVITFMVPALKFDDTIDQLGKLGKVQNEHISGQDVSAQYVDLQARLGNEEAQRDAMLALLAKAQSVSDIIAVQNQLGQITQQIEELKGQIAYIEHNTTYSTITVQITEAGAPAAPPTSDTWGFVTALNDAAHNFVTTVNYIITGLGAIGPVVLLLGAGLLLWRRRGWALPRRA